MTIKAMGQAYRQSKERYGKNNDNGNNQRTYGCNDSRFSIWILLILLDYGTCSYMEVVSWTCKEISSLALA